MPAHLVACDGDLAVEGDAVAEAARRLVAERRLFWLDLEHPTRDELAILRDPFAFHPLSIEDSESFGQRPKLEEYSGYVFAVVFGWSPDEDGLVEVHCFIGARYVVTVRRDPAPALETLKEALRASPSPPRSPAMLFHHICDRLVDSFFPELDGIEDRIDEVEERVSERARDPDLREIIAMRRTLSTFRRVLAPQRTVLATVVADASPVPALSDDERDYFRDVQDHLARLGERVDLLHERLASAREVYQSTLSNRLNEVIRQLTIISTVFLPLTFLTGFFGQNFGWLVAHVDTGAAFAGLGIGLEVVAALFLLLLFRRRGWL
jgi:magnesium transporter